jgi:hypothetical protein
LKGKLIKRRSFALLSARKIHSFAIEKTGTDIAVGLGFASKKAGHALAINEPLEFYWSF